MIRWKLGACDTNTFIHSVFPQLPKLEMLSVSYMAKLTTIGNGAFSKLAGLQRFQCTNNPKLTVVHEAAFSRAGKEDVKRLEWPPLREVTLLDMYRKYGII